MRELRYILTVLFFITSYNNIVLFANNRQEIKIATLQGEVISKSDKKHIPFATIVVEGNERYYTTVGPDGKFKLQLPTGKQRIIVSMFGFETFTKDVDTDTNKGTSLVIALHESSTIMDKVKVVAKSRAKKFQEQGFNLNSINTQSIALSTIDTDELLNRSAGVNIRQDGGLGSDANYTINGLSGNSVRIYIDGVPISNYGPNFSISTIPPAQIRRVDVFKGVVPSYLADDAMGGAINVILKENSINRFSSSYSFGSYNTHRADASGQYRSQKGGFTAGGSAYYNYSDNNYKVWGDEVVYVTDMTTFQNTNVVAERFHDSYESYGVSANTGLVHRSWADRLKFDMLYSRIDKDIQHGASMQVVYGERRTRQQSYVANMDYSKRDILPRLDIKIKTSYSYINRLLIDTCTYQYGWHGDIYMYKGEPVKWVKGGGEGGAASLESNMENNVATRLNLEYAIDKAANHKVSFNMMYTNFRRNVDDPYLSVLEQMLTETRSINKVTSSVSYDSKFFKGKLRSSIFYKYFMQEAILTDPIVENGVTIAQNYSNDITDGGYGGAISYAFTPSLSINFSGERAIRLPGFTELLGDVSNNIEATMDLKPEQSINFNLGTFVGPIKLGRGDISLDANLFYRDVTNMIERSIVDANDDLYGFENIGAILSQGVDAEATYNHRNSIGELYLSVNAAYTDAIFNLEYNDMGISYLQYGNRLRNQPYLTSSGKVSYTIERMKGALTVNYNVDYTHEFFVNWECFGSTNKATVPMQLTHDIGVVYKFPSNRYAVSVDAKNIFNEQVYDNYALQKPGRWISAKFTYNLF